MVRSRFFIAISAVIVAAAIIVAGFFLVSAYGGSDIKTGQAAGPGEQVGFRPLLGRWASDSSALPGLGERFVSLTIASDGKYVLEMRGNGPRTEIIFYSYRGQLSNNSSGLYRGCVYHQPDELSALSSFSLGKPQNGNLLMTGEKEAFQLRYRGL